MSGGGAKNCGSSVTVEATANPCFNFVNWTENGEEVSTQASYSFTAGENRTLVANFIQPSYTISTSSSPENGGTTSGGGSKVCGASGTASAIANAGFSFVSWTEGGVVLTASSDYNFIASGDRSLVANFALAPIVCR